MSAVWLVIALLNLSTSRTPRTLAEAPRGKIPSPQIIMASLRENRRELLEMIQSPDSHDAGPEKLFPAQPRSERRYETLTA